MQGCVRKRDAILIEVVAYANLATEGITTRVKIDFVILVITSLYQDGHVQIGITDGIDNTNFETDCFEIGFTGWNSSGNPKGVNPFSSLIRHNGRIRSAPI